MQAVVMDRPGPPEVLRMQDVAYPSIEGGRDMLIRVHAAGVNPIDAKLRSRGMYFPEEMPAVPGCDGAGVVEAVGPDVSRFSPGHVVYYCYGGLGRKYRGNYAEFTLVQEAYAAKMPVNMDFEHAAAAPLVLITAWESLFDRARIKAGRKVLIHAGAGGVGHVAVQLARIAGAQVATTVSCEEKATFVKELGADRIIHYRKRNFVEDVLEWTDGEGVDMVFDTVGGEVFNRSIASVRHYGDLVTILQVPADADWKTARLRNLRISQELMLSPMLFGLKQASHHGEILERCAAHIDVGMLRVHVANTLPLEEAVEAHRLIEKGSALGKIVLKIR